MADSSALNVFLLSQETKKHVPVSLSGDGADELFGGYPRYKNIASFWNKIKKQPKVFSELMEAFSESFSSSESSYMRSIGKKFRKYSHTNLDSLYNDEMSRGGLMRKF